MSFRTIACPAALLILVLVALLVPIPFHGRAWQAIGDLMHAPIFGGLCFATLVFLQRQRPLRRSGWALAIRGTAVAASFFVFGIGIELAQRALARDAALHDVIANGLGAVAATLAYAGWRLRADSPGRWRSRMMWGIAGFLLALAWSAPLTVLRDVVSIYWDYPMLASFESRRELDRFYFRECTAELTRRDAVAGDWAMEITYQPTPFPGASMTEFSRDWSAMKSLEMDVALDESYTGEQAVMMVKVIDESNNGDHHDTYRGQWLLVPGQRQPIRVTRDELIRGPDTRPLDLSNIQFVDLLLMEPGETTKVRVDAIRLRL